MTVVPTDPWYGRLLAAVQAQQDGVVDRVGRPWAQHFERVALRTLFRNPAAPRAQLEAALLHDAFMDRGGGDAMLASLGVGAEATTMIRITNPPARCRLLPRFRSDRPRRMCPLPRVRPHPGGVGAPAGNRNEARRHLRHHRCLPDRGDAGVGRSVPQSLRAEPAPP